MIHGIKHLFERNYIENYLGDLLSMQELIGVISYVLLTHKKYKINNIAVMMEEAMGFIKYQKIQQQKH